MVIYKYIINNIYKNTRYLYILCLWIQENQQQYPEDLTLNEVPR